VRNIARMNVHPAACLGNSVGQQGATGDAWSLLLSNQ
jgi:hypothetical protein